MAICDISRLDLPKEVLAILEKQGLTTLYPPQAEAVEPALSGHNLVLAIPTASGKSLVAYLAILKKVLAGGKALYIVPLRALATEKHEELKEFEPLGIKVGVATGDYDSEGKSLDRYDILVATSEKADSLLRHRTGWLSELSIIVADEVHLIGDPDRGPTLEVILSRFRALNPKSQLVALSATIPNARELAGWMDAKLVTSDWRPVKLKEGVLYDGEVRFTDNSVRKVGEGAEPAFPLIKQVLSEGGQCLIFVNTRKSAETMARKVIAVVKPSLAPDQQRTVMADDLRGGEGETTSMGGQLADCVRSGTAFHHAGLTSEQRKAVESGFRSGRIKVLAATPTLAAGINLPARCVIVRDVKRFEAGAGQVYISVREIKQMAGRAGRPKYDREGEAVLIAKTENDFHLLFEEYLLGPAEPVESRLGVERALRVHTLSSVASGFSSTEDELHKFFCSTFWACQTHGSDVNEQTDRALDFLVEEHMVERKGTALLATVYGKRVSELYIDPLSAKTIREALKSGERPAIAYLHVAASTPDLRKVGMYLRKGDTVWLDEIAEAHRNDFLIRVPDEPGEYEWFLADLKLACLLEDWIDEKTEDEITSRYDIGPGDIRTKVDTARWLVYSMKEMARLSRIDCVDTLDGLCRRVEQGIKEELLELVRLRGIGRVRARALFTAGYKNLTDIANADAAKLAHVPRIGPRVAQALVEQLGRYRKEPGKPPPADATKSYFD